MKHFLALSLISLSFSMLVGQTKSAKEIKGDAYFFSYNYEKALTCYGATNLSENGMRSYAAALVKTNRTLDAERQYVLLIDKFNKIHSDDYYNYANVLRINGKHQLFDEWMDKFAVNNPADLRVKSYQSNKKKEVLTNNCYFNLLPLTVNTIKQEFATVYLNEKLVFVTNKSDYKLVKRTDNRSGQAYLTLVEYAATSKTSDANLAKQFKKNKYNVGPASFNKEGTFMAVTSNMLKDKSADQLIELQIHFSTLTANGWSKPVAFAYNNTSYSVGQPALSDDGKTMYFTSDMPGGFGGTDLYVTTQTVDNSWSAPKNLGNKINTEGNELFPFYQKSTAILYFSSDGHYGQGGLDVFRYKNDAVTNMGKPVNSVHDDFAFILNRNNDTGYLSSNRNEANLSDDLYKFSFQDSLKITKRIEGLATTNNSEKLSNVLVSLIGADSTIQQTVTTSDDGAYVFKVLVGNSFQLIGTRNGFTKGTNSVIVSGNDSVFNCDLFLAQPKNEIAAVVVEILKIINTDSIQLAPIYFNFNDYSIRMDAVENLENIIALMNKYPTIEIQLKSYTDCRGSKVYNQFLSEQRAAASVTYIQTKIAYPERISGVGLGESELVNNCICEDEVKSFCSEAEHQRNRRTTFHVLKK